MVERVLFGPGGATEIKQDAIIGILQNRTGLRIDYTGGPTAADPVYIGVGPFEAAETDLAWKVQKITYTGSNITKIETRPDMAWSARATPTPAWD